MHPSQHPTRYAIGTMTGTSMDGIDASLIGVSGTGLDLHVSITRTVSASLGDLTPRLRQAAAGSAIRADQFVSLAYDLAIAHIKPIELLVRDLPTQADLALCAIHGQTLFHAPPLSLQLINPWPIANRFNCPVVTDLRGADLAAGGQGAPITPLADWVLFRNSEQPRVIVNLGGYCNLTILPPVLPHCQSSEQIDAVQARDVCVCNLLLDAAADRALGQPYDQDGAAALAGTIHHEAADALCAALQGQIQADRSLGTGDESRAWLDCWADVLDAQDLLATATHAVGSIVGRYCATHAPGHAIYVAGGGSYNRALMRAIAAGAGVEVQTTDALGVAVHARESAAMGVLGLLAADGVNITLKNVTGRDDSVRLAGQWTTPPPPHIPPTLR